MKERPILFSAPMVRALLAGTKTQTRRAAKVESTLGIDSILAPRRAGGHAATYLLPEQAAEAAVCCPYGQPGDRLWVREAWAETRLFQASGTGMVVYREGDNRTDYGGPWKPSIHMRRRDSRILLEITSVRVERLQDIHPVDALKEGLEQCEDLPYRWDHPVCLQTAVKLYSELWEQINGPGSWAQNPWVWVVEFKRIQQASSGRPSQLENAPCSA